MPSAARVGDSHTCPIHPEGKVLPAGCPTVLIGDRPAARMGDQADCKVARDSITKGEPTVFVADQMAARVGDPCEHGGSIAEGCPTVFIGSSTQFGVMREAAERGAPLVEECPTAKGGEPAAPDQAGTLVEAARRGTAFVEECPARGRS